MRTAVVCLVAGVTALAACGDDDPPGALSELADDASAPGTQSGDGSGDDASGDDASSGDAAAPEPVGPADMDTIRIGSQVWERTLPMTTGQCFVFEDDGVLPSSATAWGTLGGDDDVRFSVSANQDGTFEADVESENEYWWLAGPRSSGPDDLVVELDFDALTVTGQGTFTNLYTGETAAGSFAIQCEDDGTGTG